MKAKLRTLYNVDLRAKANAILLAPKSEVPFRQYDKIE